MQTRQDSDPLDRDQQLNDEVPVGFSVGVIQLDQGVDALLL